MTTALSKRPTCSAARVLRVRIISDPVDFSKAETNEQCKKALENVKHCEGTSGVGCNYYATLSQRLCN